VIGGKQERGNQTSKSREVKTCTRILFLGVSEGGSTYRGVKISTIGKQGDRKGGNDSRRGKEDFGTVSRETVVHQVEGDFKPFLTSGEPEAIEKEKEFTEEGFLRRGPRMAVHKF